VLHAASTCPACPGKGYSMPEENWAELKNDAPFLPYEQNVTTFCP